MRSRGLSTATICKTHVQLPNLDSYIALLMSHDTTIREVSVAPETASLAAELPPLKK